MAFVECPKDQAEESFAKIQETFPKKQTRRMSRLGILIAHVLKEAQLSNCPLIYATRYTETRALEKYLDSFPDASPTQFQTSIHPGGVEQALILAKKELKEIIPLAGGIQLPMSALQQVFLSDEDEVFLVGGEETGTWLLDFGLASDVSFSFAASFSKVPNAASLCLQWDPKDVEGEIKDTTMLDLARALNGRNDFFIQHPDFGKFSFLAPSCES
jgi:hypothetical protein